MDALSQVLQGLNPWWSDAQAGLRLPPSSTYRRRPYGRIRERLLSPATRGLLLYGLRRIGKTEISRQLFDEHLIEARRGQEIGPSQLAYLDVDDALISGQVTIADLIRAWSPHRDPAKPALVVVDEAHRLGEGPGDRGKSWARQLKGLVDLGNIRLLATGSSTRIMLDAGVEAPGRWSLQHLEPLNFREFRELSVAGRTTLDAAERFRDLQAYLTRGGFPALIFVRTPEEAHRATQERVRQVLDLEIPGSRNTDRLQLLYKILLERSGEHIDVTTLSKALGHARPTVEQWLAQLEQALLIQRIPRMASSTLHELRGQPKVCAPDPGLIAAFAWTRNPYADPRVRSRLQEAAVLRHLREVAEWGGMRIQCLQRISAKRVLAEGDFILSSDQEAILIEVASQTDLPQKRARQEQFAKEVAGHGRFRDVRAMVIHGGSELVPGRVPLIPLADFLERLSLGFDVDPLSILRAFAERIEP